MTDLHTQEEGHRWTERAAPPGAVDGYALTVMTKICDGRFNSDSSPCLHEFSLTFKGEGSDLSRSAINLWCEAKCDTRGIKCHISGSKLQKDQAESTKLSR